jgi:predicted HAD superfamily Cof-like phosphohydrolase
MASITLNDLVRYTYPAARPLVDYAISVDNVGADFVSQWRISTLGPQPTTQALEANRVAVQQAADAVAAAEVAEQAQIVAILAVADDMINGVGTTAQRQVRVETSLGRLLKRLAKTGKIP